MKKGIHPANYRLVVFQDTSNGATFLTKSTCESSEEIKWQDGNTYPLVSVHISSASHSFYTGNEKLVDIEGRVDRFKSRTEAAQKRRQEMATKVQKQQKRAQAKQEKQAQKLGSHKPSSK